VPIGQPHRLHRDAGFSLLEALVATTILAVGVVALAQLFIVSMQANRDARVASVAATVAEAKVEQLRGLTWAYDAAGLPLTDTTSDTTVVPERASGGTGLSASPAAALSANVAGYCDFLGAWGEALGGGAPGFGGGTVAPDGAAYIRRWSIDPLPADPGDTIVLRVLVAPIGARSSDQVTVTTVRRRRHSS
jgi:type II secretory pathway pseudopilin PulG